MPEEKRARVSDFFILLQSVCFFCYCNFYRTSISPDFVHFDKNFSGILSLVRFKSFGCQRFCSEVRRTILLKSPKFSIEPLLTLKGMRGNHIRQKLCAKSRLRSSSRFVLSRRNCSVWGSRRNCRFTL